MKHIFNPLVSFFLFFFWVLTKYYGLAVLISWANLKFLAVSAMLPLAKQCAFEEPSVETITAENTLTWPHVVSPLVLLVLTLFNVLPLFASFRC